MTSTWNVLMNSIFGHIQIVTHMARTLLQRTHHMADSMYVQSSLYDLYSMRIVIKVLYK